MGTLNEDLQKYSDELFTKGDLKAGLKLVGEISGAIAIGGLALTVMTSWLPAIGITVGAGTIAKVTYEVAKGYAAMPSDERKEIRAAISWLKGGFNLGDRLID